MSISPCDSEERWVFDFSFKKLSPFQSVLGAQKYSLKFEEALHFNLFTFCQIQKVMNWLLAFSVCIIDMNAQKNIWLDDFNNEETWKCYQFQLSVEN